MDDEITNTSKDERMPWAVMGGNPRAIEAQEVRGQQELLHSTKLPRSGGEDHLYEELGFVFGPQVPSDDLFRDAHLPIGWKREKSDHTMWSYIVDERNIRRVAIFYKAAFYDRDAFMQLVNVGPDFVTQRVYWEETDSKHRPEWTEVYTPEELEDAIRHCKRNLADEYTSDKYRAKYQECLDYLEGFRG